VTTRLTKQSAPITESVCVARFLFGKRQTLSKRCPCTLHGGLPACFARVDAFQLPDYVKIQNLISEARCNALTGAFDRPREHVPEAQRWAADRLEFVGTIGILEPLVASLKGPNRQ